MPRRFRRRQDDPELAHDMAELVKKLRARKKRLRKHANEDEVANVFKGQRFSDEDVKMGPRNKGWQIIDKQITKGEGGVIMEKTTRIRSFGRMKKTAFFRGFKDELEKKGYTLIEALVGLGVGGTLAGVGGHALYKHLKKKKGQTKKAAYLEKFSAEAIAKMLIEPNKKKSNALAKNPFLRLQAKRKLVSGQGRTSVVPKSGKLMSGSAQYAHLTRQERREAS